MRPYHVLFGRIARLLDTMLPLIPVKHVDARPAIEYCQAMARANIAGSQWQSSDKARAWILSTVTLVWMHLLVRKKGETDKLENSWTGPCTVLWKVSDVLYEVQTVLGILLVTTTLILCVRM